MLYLLIIIHPEILHYFIFIFLVILFRLIVFFLFITDCLFNLRVRGY